MALFFETPLPFTAALTIIDDPNLGRCFSSQRHYRTGEVIFTEKALVWADFDEEERLDKRVRKLYEKAYPKAVLKSLNDLIEELARLDSVQSVDTAKNLLQLIALSVLRKRNEIAAVSEFAEVADDREISLKMHYLDHLTAANREKCTSDVALFRKAYPKVIPKIVTDEDAGHMLGLLNTNQLELEELGGSGLFVGTAITEHSCYPNCSFTTTGHTLYMTAIRDIAEGERISIDYGNNFYHPTADRVESLQESYGFTCVCPTCQGPDRKRAFVCRSCYNGIVCPIGMGSNTESDSSFSSCNSCGNAADRAYRQLCLSKEEQYKNDTPITLGQIKGICSVERILHENHYLLFWACDDIAMLLASKARRESSYTPTVGKLGGDALIQSRQCYRDALTAMSEAVRLLEAMLPPVHHEKVVYYDRLGQLAIAAGELSFADTNFKKAYEMSCLASGEQTPCTLEIKKLVSHPPQSLEELIAHYGKNNRSLDFLNANDDVMDES